MNQEDHCRVYDSENHGRIIGLDVKHRRPITTDQNGYSTFPARRLRVNLLMRIIRTIINFNFHGNPGPVAIIHVLAPYEAATSEPYYEPSRPLVKRIVVRRSSELQ